ncbi:beta-propeller domain-containing protein [Bacteroides timonensis]|uniref:hypothetical protein n=1 Tax=Bacteroides timonensis TaxID=1470345 RepID=UPI0004BBDFDF|nr:hypothetical protein [Bacteroides timonensis]
MKKALILKTLAVIVLTGVLTPAYAGSMPEGKTTKVITEGIRFCESTYPYNGGILIANFGTEQLNPLNREKKGYILYYKDGKITTLIPADGNLSAPKGMFERNGYLYICDVNQLVIYNLKAVAQPPQIIRFPADDLFLNDLAASGNTLYISVTNSGRIYTLDISNPAKQENSLPVKWLDITGPNGITIDGNTMYIASYPADGNTTEANVIYKVSNLKKPAAEIFVNAASQYDGIAVSADKKTLYISSWTPASVSAIDMKSKQQTVLPVAEGLTGPADMTLVDGTLFIPDLPNSRVLIYKVE